MGLWASSGWLSKNRHPPARAVWTRRLLLLFTDKTKPPPCPTLLAPWEGQLDIFEQTWIIHYLQETRAPKVALEEKREGGTQDWLLLALASCFTWCIHLLRTCWVPRSETCNGERSQGLLSSEMGGRELGCMSAWLRLKLKYTYYCSQFSLWLLLSTKSKETLGHNMWFL